MFTSLDNMGKVTLMMDLITQRQRALGSNLANIDTPGYVRRDVNFGDYLNSMNSPLETKLSEKFGPSGVIDEQNYYLSPNVSSSYTHQWGSHFFKAMAGFQMELQENSLLYTMATRRMSNIITEMKTVINVGK